MFAPRLVAPALLSLAVLSGCTATVTPMATGGSRSDGIIEMSYEYSSMVVPDVDRAAAMRSARKRCKTWGYDDAEAFDGELRNCIVPDLFSCSRYRVTVEYQCIHSDGQRQASLTEKPKSARNYRKELRQIQDSMSCNNGAKIVSQSEESVKWELDCGDGETLSVRCFEDDCYLR